MIRGACVVFLLYGQMVSNSIESLLSFNRLWTRMDSVEVCPGFRMSFDFPDLNIRVLYCYDVSSVPGLRFPLPLLRTLEMQSLYSLNHNSQAIHCSM